MTNGSLLSVRATRWARHGQRVPATLAVPIAAIVLTVVGVMALGALDARAQADAPPFPADVRLHMRESATFDGGALTVSVVQIEQDSRCPKDVMCVWMGRAVVRLHVTVDGVDRGEMTATLDPTRQAPPGQLGLDAVVDRYVISVTDVQPYPDTGQRQPLDQKVVTLHVEKSAP